MRGFAVACVFASACYSPRFDEGAPCGAGGICPSTLVCAAATNTCERAGSDAVDAPATDAPAIDAAPDAAPDAAICAGPPVEVSLEYSGAIEDYALPAGDCVYRVRIDAWGAQGGGGVSPAVAGGRGAHVAGSFLLPAGTTLRILVGGQGRTGTSESPQRGGSGGGGTFVVLVTDAPTLPTPLVIAGGGGGAVGGNFATAPGGPGQIGPDGQRGAGTSGGAGGTMGGGGTSYQHPSPSDGSYHSSTGGGGFTGDGILSSNGGTRLGTPNDPGEAFIHGGAGGAAGSEGRDGGFGGGGSAGYTGGGGGGYSGGGSSGSLALTTYAGGGGGSFNAGTDPESESDVRTANGRVTLRW